ncbi:hypothetical protein FQA39_LY17327 [Lamprigera yunnana]|nr:hypothetical protein FQA39_LY17327 [Lamprigera yunnana]
MSARNKFIKKWWRKKKKNVLKSKSPLDVVRICDNPMLHGYYGFKLYINEDLVDVKDVLLKISLFESYFKGVPDKYNIETVLKSKTFFVDLSSASLYHNLCSRWFTFKEDIIKDTEHVLSYMAVAMHQLVVSQYKEFDSQLHPRILNHEPILHLKNLKTCCFGTLVSIRGTVIKASNTRQLSCKCIAFECGNCTGTQIVNQIEGVFTIPNNCPTKGCKAQSNFIPMFTQQTFAVNWQSLKVQELIGTNNYENGRVPRTIDCEATDDLVGCCIPGDDVTITDAVAIVNNKNQTNGSIERITFNTDDYYAIQKIHSQPHLFRLLVQSFCRNIYGNEMVKAGLLLTLFGGTYYEDEVASRSISHVLMVGDPGLGKSQMLLACANIAPRGLYVCGNTSTSSGLTVTMSKESNGDYSLEAGALILADQGCCCIDEFDKMTEHSSLLETMEQQSISIAKAGVTCSLSARTSIFAAGNPVGGHYNKAKTVAENLKISSPLISRFDLVFVLMDQPCKKYDKLVSERVLGLHRQRKTFTKGEVISEMNCLQDRLKHNDDDIEYLDHPLLRKYIAYARKYVHPKIQPEAQNILKKFYLEIRKHCEANNTSPITARQLESMVRLTQARAKVELREEATEYDAIDVLELIRTSFIDIFTDETGTLDFRRSQSGSGMSKEKQMKAFLSLTDRRGQELSKSTFTREELKVLAEEIGISNDRFSDMLQKLNFHGYLLKRGGNKYQLANVDY